MESIFFEMVKYLFLDNSNPESKDLTNVIKNLGLFFEADRAYIFSYKENSNLIENTHEWCTEDIAPQIDNLKEIDTEKNLPWFSDQIAKNNIFTFSDINDLPLEATMEREHFMGQDIKSILVVPIKVREKLFGFFGFDWVSKTHIFTQREIIITNLAAGLLGIFIECFHREKEIKINEERLQKSYEKIEEITQAITDILWSYRANYKGDVIETSITGQVDRFLQLSPGTIGDDFDKFFSYVHPEDIKGVLGTLDKALKTPGEEARAEYRMILPDGSVKWAFSRGKTTLLRDGTVELRGITTDITSIKKIEDK